jgi:hypothetical protein
VSAESTRVPFSHFPYPFFQVPLLGFRRSIGSDGQINGRCVSASKEEGEEKMTENEIQTAELN